MEQPHIVVARVRTPPKTASGSLSFVWTFSPSDRAQERTISVHIAESKGLRRHASTLLSRMYAGRGYGDDHELSTGLNSRSPYPHFFDQAEECGIVERIARMDEMAPSGPARPGASKKTTPDYWHTAA